MLGKEMLLKVGGVALLIAALWAGYSWQIHSAEKRGYESAEAQWKEKEARISAAAEAKYVDRLREAQDTSRILGEQMVQREGVRLKEKEDHEKAVDTAVSRALAGAERLSIRTRPAACPVPGSAAGDTAAAAGPAGPEERTDLLPEAAAELIRIGAATARDVRDYGELLDEYHALRQACTK